MASYNDVIRGLTVLAAREGGDQHNINAHHDEIYAGPDSPPDKLSYAERDELTNAGWRWDEKAGAWRRFV